MPENNKLNLTNSVDVLTFITKFCKLNERANKTPKDYGIGQLLFASEVHLMSIIANYPNYNLTQLSNVLDISKMAISSQTRKLEKKGLLRKVATNNKKEIIYQLTDISLVAMHNHDLYHQNKNKAIDKLLSRYSVREVQLVIEFLDELMKEANEYINDATRL